MEEKPYLSECLSEDSESVIQGRGKNIIPPPEKESLWKAYLDKFKDPLIIILLVVFIFSVGVSFYEIVYTGKGTSTLIEPLGIVLALLLATTVGFIFEVKAEKEFDILNTVKDSRPVKTLRRKKKGLRAQIVNVKKQDIVKGDVVRLESGDEIPADGKLLHSRNLTVDESNFTGEPYANKTAVVSEFDPEATYPSDFLLRGTTVIEGNAYYKVSAVGMDTEEGKGVEKVNEGSDVQTPLNKQLLQLGKLISKASFIVASLILLGRMAYYFFFDGDMANNSNVLEIIEFILGSIMIAVTLVVVAVPEGLPMSITISLALSMRKMLKSNNLVRKLHACETMGAATVICTDKTGTLTQNKMQVADISIYTNEAEKDIIVNMAVNSTAELSEEDDSVNIIGNPTEGALLLWLRDKGIDYSSLRDSYTITEQHPFSTETKFMETTVKNDDGSQTRYIKGAPEILIAMCGGKVEGSDISAINDKLHEYQHKAMRTLAFASQRIEPDGKRSDIAIRGIVGIADPIRTDVKEAIATCRNNAGVRVIIVTGDTAGTANEIGRQIGLVGMDEADQQTTGAMFAAMSDEEASKLVNDPNFKIISRARPEDKARLVTLLQANNHVVAVTGDGTNDAPALSKAQVGLSMGSGTARAKEASDITIIDNSFSSINKAILWGRSIYLNIRRFILFQLTINICACFIVLFGTFLGLDSPLTVTQMLWVNLIMDTFAAMALSALPPDESVMYEKPRNPMSHIIDRKMAKTIILGGGAFFLFLLGMWQLLWHINITSEDGFASLLNIENIKLYFTGFASISRCKQHMDGYELGIFFSLFVMIQFWNLFNSRYYHTGRSLIEDIIDIKKGRRKLSSTFSRSFLLIAMLIILGQIFIVNFAGEMFSVKPLSATDWILMILCTSPVLILPDIVRLLSNKRKQTNQNN